MVSCRPSGLTTSRWGGLEAEDDADGLDIVRSIMTMTDQVW